MSLRERYKKPDLLGVNLSFWDVQHVKHGTKNTKTKDINDRIWICKCEQTELERQRPLVSICPWPFCFSTAAERFQRVLQRGHVQYGRETGNLP